MRAESRPTVYMLLRGGLPGPPSAWGLMRVSPLACVPSGGSIDVLAVFAILLRAKAFEKLLIEVYSTSQARVKLHLCAGVCCKLQHLMPSLFQCQCNTAKSCNHGDSLL